MNNVIKCMLCTEKCHLIRRQFLFAFKIKYCSLLFDRILVTFHITFCSTVCFQNEWLQYVFTRNYHLHKRCSKKRTTNYVCILNYCAIETISFMTTIQNQYKSQQWKKSLKPDEIQLKWRHSCMERLFETIMFNVLHVQERILFFSFGRAIFP